MPRVLRYAFFFLTLGTLLVLVLNLTAYFGISSDGWFLRGEVATQGLSPQSALPMPDQGEMRVYDFKESRLVMLDFATARSFFQVRHLAYLLFQNLTWALVAFVLYQMYRIFSNLEARGTFRDDNVRRLRWIALAILFYPFVSLESELLFKSIVSKLPGHGLSFSSVYVVTEQMLFGLFVSLVVYALSEVFRYGTQLQQEQDLTI
ncbi:MAG TPA: DUF2975 domain-containing protein [Saprospiraceae bacterium]|nr:DUF2975 domain-containing protein [Saprospiraceae bacterium]